MTHSRYLSIALLATVFCVAALADQSGNATLAPNTFFNLDTGSASARAGDILWSGSALLPQGRAGLYNGGKYGARGFKSVSARYAASAPYTAAPIPGARLVAGDVFGVRTNAGHYAKVLVTAVTGSSLSIQYTTFTGGRTTAAGPTPSISRVQNNYSYLLPGQPNYGIAPGSIFVITGENLSTAFTPLLQDSSAPGGLPTTLNNTTVSVKVNGVTTTPALYYASANAVAGVLPSNTSAGNGTVTVTVNGTPSSPAPIKVVASAPGLDTLYGTGVGAGVIQDINFNLFSFTNSAMPGQPVILWGSGVGGDSANDDRTFPQNQDNLTNVPMQVFVGGISANILYRGRSQYPGLDEIDFDIPNNVTPGCYVSVTVQTGNIVSNTVNLPVSAAGGPCSDTGLGMSGTQLSSLASKGLSTINSLLLAVSQDTNLDGIKTGAGGLAYSGEGVLIGAGDHYASLGNCSVIQHGLPIPVGGALDAGTIQLTSPAGNVSLADRGGDYKGTLPPGSLKPGTYTLTGSGGADIGKFQVSLNVQTPFSLTGTSGLSTITRSQGATVTWSGGFPNSFVLVNGVGPFYPNGSTNFFCYAPAGPGQFSIPASILLAMPAGAGNLFISNATLPQPVTATGLDFGGATAEVSFEVPTKFN